MFEKLDKESLKGFVLTTWDPKSQHFSLSVIKSWEQIHVKGPELRARVGQRKESYKQWIKESIELVKLPFIIEGSSQPMPVELAPPLMSFKEDNELKARVLQL